MAVYSNGLEVEPPTIYRAQVIRQTDEREIAPMEVRLKESQARPCCSITSFAGRRY
jgi:hypothetical protein